MAVSTWETIRPLYFRRFNSPCRFSNAASASCPLAFNLQQAGLNEVVP